MIFLLNADCKYSSAWKGGQVISSPLYIGIKNGNQVTRFGYNHWRVQDVTQNGIHKHFPFGRQHYYNQYSFEPSWYGYWGYNNPFTLY